MITLDIFGRTLNMEVSDEELAKRRDAWTPPKPHYPVAMVGCMHNIFSRPTRAAI